MSTVTNPSATNAPKTPAQSGDINVGLYFDLRNPSEWHQDPTRLHGFTLEMCEEAEHLGAHSVWFTEHHLFDDGYLAQPLTFAAAVAARTRNIRIGTAIVIAPLHHPAELAEQSALVDIISGGRMDLGIGAGYRVPEFELFDASMQKKYAQTDNRAREIRRLWGEVTPRPVQDPMPLWMGYQGPQGAKRAGLLGDGLLTADATMWPHYREGLEEAGHGAERGRMTGNIASWVTEDPDRDWPTVSKHFKHQVDSYRRHMVMGTDQPTPREIDPERLRDREPRTLGYIWCTTPEETVARTWDYIKGAPVETIYFWASLSGMPEEMVAEQVQTICTKVAPLLKAGPQAPE